MGNVRRAAREGDRRGAWPPKLTQDQNKAIIRAKKKGRTAADLDELAAAGRL